SSRPIHNKGAARLQKAGRRAARIKADLLSQALSTAEMCPSTGLHACRCGVVAMENQSPRNHGQAERWTVRLDRLAGELNAFLLVLAIGLAILDFTCFFAFKVRDALPSPARIEADRSLMAKPAAA